MLKAYKYRLLPTPEQAARLDAGMGACRFIYNLALETKKGAWESARKNLTAFDLIKQITELKSSGLAEWLKEPSIMALQQSILDMDKAYVSFFNGGGFPKFKKKSGSGSMRFPKDIRIKDGMMWLPKYKWLNFIQHREIPAGAEIRSATVSRTSSRAYFVSVLVNTHQSLPEKKEVTHEGAVGIDLGLKTFAVLSDGQEIANPRFFGEGLKRLRVEQRKLSRRYKKGVKISEQSKGYHKQRLVVAKLQERITNQRTDFLHKTSTAITKQFDTICIENLNVGGMVKNRNLSKAISDASWSEFARMLEYKCNWYGKNLMKIGRFVASSKTCSECGAIKSELSLAEREWTCECGITHGRDINAAINIKKIGLQVKPSFVKTAH